MYETAIKAPLAEIIHERYYRLHSLLVVEKQMVEQVRTWHYGLIARWWAEFLADDHEQDVEYFRRAIERHGEPVLDAGCGTGRLLLPLQRAALDVDGSDASQDMLDWCQKQAVAEDLSFNLYHQAMHQLDIPRRYRTIIVCGAFGLGAGRSEDLEGLRRIHHHLEPGGALVMDHYLPSKDGLSSWTAWVKEPELPRQWSNRGDRRRNNNGVEMELRVRQLAFNPLEQTTTLEMKAIEYDGDAEVAVETNQIDINLYFKNEIELMLTTAGFQDITVTSFPHDEPPQPWQDGRLVFHAIA